MKRLTGEQIKEQVSKLPKWAQDYIRVLENELDSTKDYMNVSVDDDTPIIYKDTVRNIAFRIPEHSVIEFKVDSGIISVGLRKGVVEMYAHPHRIILYPEAANHITVEVEK